MRSRNLPKTKKLCDHAGDGGITKAKQTSSKFSMGPRVRGKKPVGIRLVSKMHKLL